MKLLNLSKSKTDESIKIEVSESVSDDIIHKKFSYYITEVKVSKTAGNDVLKLEIPKYRPTETQIRRHSTLNSTSVIT